MCHRSAPCFNIYAVTVTAVSLSGERQAFLGLAGRFPTGKHLGGSHLHCTMTQEGSEGKGALKPDGGSSRDKVVKLILVFFSCEDFKGGNMKDEGDRKRRSAHQS